ncbi:unnamed protein product, partial [Tetraodon nigroviridis]
RGRKDACEGPAVKLWEKGTGTEVPVVRDQGAQTRVDTTEAEVWVMESLLGVTSEAQREMDALQDTQESIGALEKRLSEADKDLLALKAQLEERNSKDTSEKGVSAQPDLVDAQVETETPPLKHASAQSGAEVADACVGQSLTDNQTPQSTQTEAVVAERAAALVSPEETVSMAQKMEEEEQLGAKTTLVSTRTGVLKSIMKRKDGSSAEQSRTSSKKSLQFFGILNGGYESTSSEEEEEEDGSSSDESGDGECLDSTEDEAALDEETSEEERNVNLDESDTDEDTPSAYSSVAVKEKFEFGSKMREACLILRNHLNDEAKALRSKEVVRVCMLHTHTVQLEWFRVSSAKTAQPSRVSDYLMAF